MKKVKAVISYLLVCFFIFASFSSFLVSNNNFKNNIINTAMGVISINNDPAPIVK